MSIGLGEAFEVEDSAFALTRLKKHEAILGVNEDEVVPLLKLGQELPSLLIP